MSALPPLKGKLLVATPLLADPNFARTVVLLCDHDAEGAFGLVLNRPLEAEMLELVPGWGDRCARPAVLFDGGPVRRSAAMALGLDRTGREPPWWTAVRPGVGLIDLRRQPEDLPGSLESVRIFSGYAGWSATQLQEEIREEAWWIVDGHTSDIFTPTPDDLWRTVVRREPRIALHAFLPERDDLN